MGAPTFIFDWGAERGAFLLSPRAQTISAEEAKSCRTLYACLIKIMERTQPSKIVTITHGREAAMVGPLPTMHRIWFLQRGKTPASTRLKCPSSGVA